MVHESEIAHTDECLVWKNHRALAKARMAGKRDAHVDDGDGLLSRGVSMLERVEEEL